MSNQMSSPATAPQPVVERLTLEVVNTLNRATMAATIAAIDAVTADDVHALLEASTIGCGADYATIIAELDAKPTNPSGQRP